MNLDKLREHLESEDGKDWNDFISKNREINTIHESQLKRFHEKHSFEFRRIVELILNKYNSKEYGTKWYNLGIEPPENLLFFLYDYAEEYGRGCSDEEYIEYGNTFTAGMYYINGYYFNKMNGQGTVIKVMKSLVEERKDKLKKLD
jgi:hypothetical protein